MGTAAADDRVLFQPLSRTRSGQHLEIAIEMGLVGIAAHRRDLGQRSTPRVDHPPGTIEAHDTGCLLDPDAELGTELAVEMPSAPPDAIGEE